jgi:hypothetical protein
MTTTRRAFVLLLQAEPGVDAIKALRALLKTALRRYGLRALDVRQCAPAAQQDKRAWCSTREIPMSEFSERIRGQKKGFFKVVDIEAGEKTFTISHLDEAVEMFGKSVDVLNFVETGQQLQLNQTNAEVLLDAFGDDPAAWAGQRVTLYLRTYTYEGKTGLSIRLRKAGAPKPAAASTPEHKPPFANAPAPRSSAPGNGGKPDFDDEMPF